MDVTIVVLLLVGLAVSQSLAVSGDATCTTLECCRDQYLASVRAFDWCVRDVVVAEGGHGCTIEPRCEDCGSTLHTCGGMRSLVEHVRILNPYSSRWPPDHPN